jgi:hypothetical protein
MAHYKFNEINGGIAIENPTITICDVIDKRNGTAIVYVLIESSDTGSGHDVSFKVPLITAFTYTGEQPMKSEIDAWFDVEIQNYLVH